MTFAKRAQATIASATAEVFKRVAELRTQGVHVVSLAVGEPDFDPPKHVRDAAKDALERGPHGYTPVAGLPVLRQAICERSKQRRELAHSANEVVVSAGAKHALWNVAQVLYEAGDEVIIPTPCWVSYAEHVRLCGATPVFVACRAEDGYLLTPQALARALTPKTKALVLCTPNNPTGAAYDADQLRALASLIEKHSLWVISDEIYGELCYDGFSAPSILQVAPTLRERTVIVDGVSKSYAMTGFRLGWALAPSALARACEVLQSQTTSSVSTVSQVAAIAALTRDQACVRKMRETYERRRVRLIEGLNRIGGIRCAMPRGAFYAFADVRALLGKRSGNATIDDDVAFAKLLLEREGVAVVPGTAFHAPGHVRLSYAAALADLEEATARIASFVHSLT